MNYLVDSDWVAAYLKGRPEALTLLRSLAPDGLAISLITHAEIYEGVVYGRNPRENERGFRLFLREVTVLPVNRSISKRFGVIRGDLRRRGLMIGDLDIMIAATALAHDLTLLTRNVRDFGRLVTLHNLKLTTGTEDRTLT